MSLPKYATKEEVQLALSLALDTSDRANDPYHIISYTNWIRLLKTTAKLYEIVDAIQDGLRQLESLAKQSESKKDIEPVSDDPRPLPNEAMAKPRWYGLDDRIQDQYFILSWNKRDKPEGGFAE